ncbi:MAG TPA: PQQ-binding-like beta-propeller repeat protein [Deinococcales bacterium]|nr:PQQ-binding-like beta-propeller repeat protein [Deinococcales bacterium]
MVGEDTSGRLGPGTVLGGRYRLVAPVGEGGMAVVWRAHDTHLKRDVALKLLHEHVLPVDRERFGREIRTLARLSHPFVVSIYDLGEDGGRTYFTMELLEGGTVSEIGPVEDHPEDLERFLAVAAASAQALAHVHASGMVHRDLTPRNVLLGADGSPRIMDFGLVYVSDATRDLTRTGYTLGTPQYMAPEQARGGIVGPASDRYALGAVLYRAATGRAPFEADNDQAILYQHVYEAPPTLRAANPAVPRCLDDTVLALLSKKPEDRPGDVAAVLDSTGEELRRTHHPSHYRGGRARAGLHPGGPSWPRNLTLAWERRLPGEVSWPAAVTATRDLIAVGTRSGSLALLELASGTPYAQFPAGDEVTAPATFSGGCVVYGSWDGVVHCADLRSGVERWTYRTRAEVTAAPTLWGDDWLVASRDGHLHALDADGALQWAYKAGAAVAATPAFWGGLAIVADEGGWVHALDPSSGKLAWKVELGAVHATPCVSRHPDNRREGVLVVPTWAGEVHALRLLDRDGRVVPDDEPLWSYDLEGQVWASPAAAGGRVFATSWAGQLRALELATGDDVWEFDLGGRVTASPVVSRGTVYAAGESGEVLAVNAATGAVAWRDRLDGKVQATPLVVDGALLVPLMDGRLRCYRG